MVPDDDPVAVIVNPGHRVPGAISRHGFLIDSQGILQQGQQNYINARGLGDRRPSTCGENSPVIIPAVAKLYFLARKPFWSLAPY